MAVNDSRPNIIVVGVGHSGTSVVTKMLGALGWNLPGIDAAETYCEHVGVRECNRRALASGCLDVDDGTYNSLLSPWAIKDPRFTVTLQLWADWFALRMPTMPAVWHISRDVDAVKASYTRRGENVDGQPGNRWRGANRGYTVDAQRQLLAQTLATWSGPVITITYEQVQAAAAMFVPTRDAKA